MDPAPRDSTWPDLARREAVRLESRALRRAAQETRARAQATHRQVRRGRSQGEELGDSPFAWLRAEQESTLVIEEAMGVIMARWGCRPKEAFDALCRASRRTGVGVDVLAARMVGQIASGGNGDNAAPIVLGAARDPRAGTRGGRRVMRTSAATGNASAVGVSAERLESHRAPPGIRHPGRADSEPRLPPGRRREIDARLDAIRVRLEELSEQDWNAVKNRAGSPGERLEAARRHAAEGHAAAVIALAATARGFRHAVEAHEHVASLHERAAAAGTGDVREHERQAALHRAAAARDRQRAEHAQSLLSEAEQAGPAAVSDELGEGAGP